MVCDLGSGLSCAEGIPGMSELSRFLCDKVPNLLIESNDLRTWQKIAVKQLAGQDLESELSISLSLSNLLAIHIV